MVQIHQWVEVSLVGRLQWQICFSANNSQHEAISSRILICTRLERVSWHATSHATRWRTASLFTLSACVQEGIKRAVPGGVSGWRLMQQALVSEPQPSLPAADDFAGAWASHPSHAPATAKFVLHTEELTCPARPGALKLKIRMQMWAPGLLAMISSRIVYAQPE